MKINGTEIVDVSVQTHSLKYVLNGHRLSITFYNPSGCIRAYTPLRANSELEVIKNGREMRIFAKKITIT
jgi:hypothetical protein